MTTAIIFPNIDPVIFDFGMIGNFPISIRWYGLLWLSGCVLAWRYVIYFFKHANTEIKKKYIDDFLIWAVLSTIIGGRVGYWLFYAGDGFSFVQIWQGGLSFHGGLMGVVVSVVVFCKKNNIPFWEFGDGIACSAPIGLFCVRIANFINGELYGRTTDLPWGIVFPSGGNLPRHPSQLYEAVLEGLLLFLILHLCSKMPQIKGKPGLLTGIFMVGYAFARSLVEVVRQPDQHIGFLLGGSTMGQWLSIPVLLFGMVLIISSIWKSRDQAN